MKQLNFFESVDGIVYIGCGTHSERFLKTDNSVLKKLWDTLCIRNLKGSIRLSDTVSSSDKIVANLGDVLVVHKAQPKMNIVMHKCACGKNEAMLPEKLSNDLKFVFLNVEVTLSCCKDAVKRGKLPQYRYMLNEYKGVSFAVYDADVLKDRKETSLFSEVPSVYTSTHKLYNTFKLKVIDVPATFKYTADEDEDFTW